MFLPFFFCIWSKKDNLGHIKRREIIPTSWWRKGEKNGQFCLCNDGGSKKINTFMCFLWSSAELELGICFKKGAEPGRAVPLDCVEACGWRGNDGEGEGAPHTPSAPCFFSLSPLSVLTGQCRTSYLWLNINTLLGLENAQDLHPMEAV